MMIMRRRSGSSKMIKNVTERSDQSRKQSKIVTACHYIPTTNISAKSFLSIVLIPMLSSLQQRSIFVDRWMLLLLVSYLHPRAWLMRLVLSTVEWETSKEEPVE